MHQKQRWSLFRRARCKCGLPWPCLELRLRSGQLHQAVSAPPWNSPTRANPQVGRAGKLTPAQAQRADGGRR
jgi:hypothetical protein